MTGMMRTNDLLAELEEMRQLRPELNFMNNSQAIKLLFRERADQVKKLAIAQRYANGIMPNVAMPQTLKTKAEEQMNNGDLTQPGWSDTLDNAVSSFRDYGVQIGWIGL
jgi:hypothetical protein